MNALDSLYYLNVSTVGIKVEWETGRGGEDMEEAWEETEEGVEGELVNWISEISPDEFAAIHLIST